MQVASAIRPYANIKPLPLTAPLTQIEDSRYLVRFARNPEEVEAALKLRFEVFNLELGEGLESSFLTGSDRDQFDATCHHLIVIDKTCDQIVGTYRTRTIEMAQNVDGFYSSGEFDLRSLPADVLELSVEVGRACIAREHRDSKVLLLLWKALARYVLDHQKRYLFGCCSLNSQEPRESQKLLEQLSARGHMHPSLWVNPQPGLECQVTTASPWPAAVAVPRLLKTYLSIGAKVCGPPAIDRLFKTIDFFVFFDLLTMNERTHKLIFDY